jgi:flagellar basal-body rod modification protein FlgD
MTAVASSSSTSNASSSASSAASSDLASGASSLSTSYSTFLTLLTTQLQNQDPTSPLDTNAFTQQLVSMTGVQQQLLTNQLLQQMVTNTGSGSVQSAVGLIGKTATATTSSATLSGGQATWDYNLPAAAANASATISNASGTVVWTGALSSLNAGDNTFTWDGKNQSGSQLADGGTYSLAVSAADSTGAAITPTLSISGTVKSVQTVSGVTEVTIGATQVPLTSVSGVTGS